MIEQVIGYQIMFNDTNLSKILLHTKCLAHVPSF